MKKVGKVRVIEVKGSPPPDPRGRLDLLLLGLGKLLTRRAETFLTSRGLPVGNQWDGPGGVQEAIQRYCDQQGLAGKNLLSPVHVAERAGLLKKQRRVGKAAS